MASLYWHDYETWGEDPSIDRPSQFAGVRTDENLNIIGEPLMLYCQPSGDFLPKPEACLVTGITPQKALLDGVPEPEFIARVLAELGAPGTCGVGYNSLRFDDEVTRYTLYRNFHDPYEREWSRGNSRWDIIDMVRLTYALRPEGIEWPMHDDGTPSFRLEQLTVANGLSHESAHDALSDVYATIDMARLIKQRQPKLYDYLYQLRSKRKVAELINLAERKPLLHISSMFPAVNGCAAFISPIAMHPVNKNAVIVFNLDYDPQPLLDLSVEEIRARIFTRAADLPEGVERLPVKMIHMNKCPVLVTPKMVDSECATRLNLDVERCTANWRTLQSLDIAEKLQQVFSESGFAARTDPERMLYDGFLSNSDKPLLRAVREAGADDLCHPQNFAFRDKRMAELLFRYRGRFYPESLTTDEQLQWRKFCLERITLEEAGGALTVTQLQQRLAYLREERRDNEPAMAVLAALELYANELLQDLSR
jgi:exodeoxyribonuclease-1